MKIVDRKTFLNMPPGTIYAKYEPCVFGGLHIKAHSLIHTGGYANDFVCQDLDVPIACTDSEDFVKQCERAEKGEDVPLDFDCYGRDGLFEKDQLFAVYSKKDVEDMIKALKEAIETSESSSTLEK